MDQSKTTRAIVPVVAYIMGYGVNARGDYTHGPGNLCAVTVQHHPTAAVPDIAKAAVALVSTWRNLHATDDPALVILEHTPSPQFQALWDLVETPRGPQHITIVVHTDESGEVYAVRLDNLPPEITYDWVVTDAKPPVT